MQAADQALEEEFRPRFVGFHDLMPRRIQEILLVASLYDSFILEEDGRLAERIYSDYASLHLSSPPRVTRVSSGAKALEALGARAFDLVVAMLRLPDMETEEFVRRIKAAHPGLAVALLTWDREGLRRRLAPLERAGLDRAFLWTGDTALFLALVKSIEDRDNLDHDVRRGDVRIVVVVEDSIRYYSTLLPLLYQEVLSQTRALMSQGLNDMDKLFRLRARPKVVLARTFEEALVPIERFPDNVLGLISDIRFPRGGAEDPAAGFELLEAVRARVPDLPFLLLSSEPENATRAARSGARFLDKNDPELLLQVRAFLKESLGFGEFLFRGPAGEELARAADLRELVDRINAIPDAVLSFHARGNHFSHWLAARGEFALASAIRPRRVEDFKDIPALRAYLVERIERALEEHQRGVIADAGGPAGYDPGRSFVRIGSGSLGGKARGIAFLGALLERSPLGQEFPTIKIRVPRTIALGSHIFERFVEENRLSWIPGAGLEDEELARRFLAGRLAPEAMALLAQVLGRVREPLAVRSSSLLEDSPDQPFSGVFATYMLPNNHPDMARRLAQLSRAIKLVFASTWSRGAIRYLRATGNAPGEERMGVVLQELVGARHGDLFYPSLSGVAQTHNFYPLGYIRPADGAATVALGLGKTVVEGGNALRFCPRHPLVLPQLADLDRVLDATQRDFWALDLSDPDVEPLPGRTAPLVQVGLERAEQDGVLAELASVLCWDDARLRDGLSASGPRVLTLAPILKWSLFPLAALLDRLLPLIRHAMAGPAEIEFAALLGEPAAGREPEFHLLQVRPLTAAEALEPVDLDAPAGQAPLVRTARAMGHGRLLEIRDIVYVAPDTFDRLATRAIVPEIERLNELLLGEGRPYLLLGPGRWGTSDPFLGIPVAWDQVTGAQVLVEVDLPDFEVEPSLGSHFFHNVTAFRVCLLSVGLNRSEEWVDWTWLQAQPALWEGRYVRHLRAGEALRVVLDGHSGKALITRPDGSPAQSRG